MEASFFEKLLNGWGWKVSLLVLNTKRTRHRERAGLLPCEVLLVGSRKVYYGGPTPGELVNSTKVTEVGTAKGSTLGGQYYEFSYKSITQSRNDLVQELVKSGFSRSAAVKTANDAIKQAEGLYGHTMAPNESPSGNVRVLVSDGTGQAATMPYEEKVATMGHELYIHALLQQQGKPYGHGNPRGPTQAQFKEVENRSKANFGGSPRQPTPRSVKPKK